MRPRIARATPRTYHSMTRRTCVRKHLRTRPKVALLVQPCSHHAHGNGHTRSATTRMVTVTHTHTHTRAHTRRRRRRRRRRRVRRRYGPARGDGDADARRRRRGARRAPRPPPPPPPPRRALDGLVSRGDELVVGLEVGRDQLCSTLLQPRNEPQERTHRCSVVCVCVCRARRLLALGVGR